MSIRIALADDHSLIRMGMRHVLSSELGFSIVGEAANVDELFNIVTARECDVVVTDLYMPGGGQADGLPMLHAFRQHFPAVKVVVLTMRDQPALLQRVRDAGAFAVLSKRDDLRELRAAIVAAFQQRSYIGTTIRRDVALVSGPCAGMVSLTGLSPREVEVVGLYVGGMSVSAVARHLKRSIKTVSTHKTSAMHKLGIRSDAELCRYGAQNGMFRRDTAGGGEVD